MKSDTEEKSAKESEPSTATNGQKSAVDILRQMQREPAQSDFPHDNMHEFLRHPHMEIPIRTMKTESDSTFQNPHAWLDDVVCTAARVHSEHRTST